ncbi:MAG TPA: amidohydrolase family protein [Puia sp.]|nr:amidohydrolase family protein [Puia sp.]
MFLNNVTPINESRPIQIVISGEKIFKIEASSKQTPVSSEQINFTSATVLPGFINSHDHLDFNCFPVLGQRKYSNYTEWGKYIHKVYKEHIDSILRIPQQLRTEWGIYKNLLAGVTTVVNHGSYLKIENPLINVYQKSQNLHSVWFENNWKWKLNNPFLKSKDCIVHTGEGADQQSSDEIDRLLKYNLFKRNLVGVHGVAMNSNQAKHFKGLVWCPESNKVLLNKHADIGTLKRHTNIIFGTDSTLTGNWNFWHHLRLARSLHLVDDSELFSMVTSSPAQLWNLNSGELTAGRDADLVIVKKKMGAPNWDDVYRTNPEDILLIISKGKIRLYDKALQSQLINLSLNIKHFSTFTIKGNLKYVDGNLPALVANIKKYNPNVNFPTDIPVTTLNETHN